MTAVPSASGATGPADADLPERYEDALAELEELVQAMESGQLPLDQLLHSYRRGAALLGHCRTQLRAVEAQVKVLEDGQLKDWSAE
jgi:exodeoxyribonuclease VII small subunit